jgi:hypothetical protein
VLSDPGDHVLPHLFVGTSLYRKEIDPDLCIILFVEPRVDTIRVARTALSLLKVSDVIRIDSSE